jgi:hypothetical protein
MAVKRGGSDSVPETNTAFPITGEAKHKDFSVRIALSPIRYFKPKQEYIILG